MMMMRAENFSYKVASLFHCSFTTAFCLRFMSSQSDSYPKDTNKIQLQKVKRILARGQTMMSKSLEGHNHMKPQDEPPTEIRMQVKKARRETNVIRRREKISDKYLLNGPLTTWIYVGHWI